MRSETLRELVYGQPFEPFEICVSDGRTFAVRHPELAIVAEDHIVVGQEGREPNVASRTHILSLRHITSASPLPSSAK